MSDLTADARAIFFDVLDRQPRDELQRYLSEACGDNSALRCLVEDLLRAHEGAGNFLGGPQNETANQPISERPGLVIGPYKLMEQIGEGGMGLVFVAEQQHPVRRKVALKVIKPGMDTRQVIARFEAERQALALMDHPNIAHVLDAGTTPSGGPYFVMELVRGVPITEFCDANRLMLRERLELFVDVCHAVQHAHHKGIIHRDLKASNILITLHDVSPVVKVIDFGVAKAIGQQLTDKTIYTRFTEMIGTPLYMSPEQAEMSGLDIDTRSDIYSLGVLLYELLTGTTPFDKERLRTASFDEFRRIVREEEPPRPSERISTLGNAATAVGGVHDSRDADTQSAPCDLKTIAAQRKSDPRRLGQLFRGELDWIVMKALEKDRKRRYETASAFAADVLRYLHDEPVQAYPPSAWYRLRKIARRNKGPVLAAALVMLALVGGIIGTTAGMVRAERQRKRADKASEDALRNLALSQTNLDLAVAAVDQFCTKVSEDARLKEHDLRPLRQNLLKTAVKFHEQLLELRGKSDPARIDLARSYHRLAQLTAEIEDHDRAIALYRQAIGEFDELPQQNREDPTTQYELSLTLAGLARLLVDIGQYTGADPVVDRAEAVLKSILESDPNQTGARLQLAQTLEAKAWGMAMTRRYADSREVARRAIAQYDRLTEDDSARVDYASKLAGAHLKLGDNILHQGIVHWRDAEAEYQTALTIQRQAVTMPGASEYDRQVLGGVLRSLGRVAKVSGRNDRAITHLNEAIQIFETLQQDQPSVLSFAHDVAVTYKELAVCESLARRTDATQRALRKSAEIWDRLVSQAPGNSMWESNFANALDRLGEIDLQQGQRDTALLYYDRSVGLLDAILLREPQSHNANTYIASVLMSRGKLLASMSRCDEAVADCDRAMRFAGDDMRDFYRVERALVVALAGDYKAAVAESRGSLESLASRCDPNSLGPCYLFGARACAHAAALVEADIGRAAADRDRLFAEYIASSIDMLRTALQAGLPNVPAARASAEFAVLRERAEFMALFSRQSEQTGADDRDPH